MSENEYKVELLEEQSFKIFKGVYNDFRAKAIEEYKFYNSRSPDSPPAQVTTYRICYLFLCYQICNTLYLQLNHLHLF